jgi:hypothetical protein
MRQCCSRCWPIFPPTGYAAAAFRALVFLHVLWMSFFCIFNFPFPAFSLFPGFRRCCCLRSFSPSSRLWRCLATSGFLILFFFLACFAVLLFLVPVFSRLLQLALLRLIG